MLYLERRLAYFHPLLEQEGRDIPKCIANTLCACYAALSRVKAVCVSFV